MCYDPSNPKRPSYIGKLTNQLIYDQLPEGVAQKLRETTPKSKSGNYTKRFFQGLTPDIGNSLLEKLLVKAMTVLELSDNPIQLKEKLQKSI